VKTNRVPAEVFPPGDFIREEMAERGWTVEMLASAAVIPVEKLQALLDNAPLPARYAERLAVAFGTSAIYWSHLWLMWKKYGKETP